MSSDFELASHRARAHTPQAVPREGSRGRKAEDG